MLPELFSAAEKAIHGTPMVAMTASFAWGIASVLLSPCHLASIPLMIGFIDQQGVRTKKRAFAVSSLFSLGMLLSILVAGLIAAAVGRMFGDMGSGVTYFVAAILLGFGLILMDVFTLPWITPSPTRMKRQGLIGGFLLGLIFGLALGPCTFVFMGPLLMMVMKVSGQDMVYGVWLILLYAIGHCAVLVVAGTSSVWVQNLLNWNDKTHRIVWMKRACGVLVVLAGLYLIYTA